MPPAARPRVAITSDRSYNVAAYIRAVEKAGGEPVSVLPGAEKPLDGIQALLLSGGSDISPNLYGAEPEPQTEADQPERDVLELAMLGHALAADLPVLAICRGLQIFNIAHGGTLLQHTGTHKQSEALPRSEPSHLVEIEPGTRLAALLGAGKCKVNSRHHQAVRRLGRGLRASATSPDGLIEALERDDRRFALAVQWHPEDMIDRDPVQLRLFEALIAAARAAAN